jgi:hypothetical protein
MTRALLILGLSLGIGAAALAGSEVRAQQAAVKAGKGEKVCRVKLKYSGQIRTWVCKKEEPCCAWHEINYVKCGSTVTGCL